MKRKVVLHGPSTLTISLPTAWVKRFNVKKGDELDVEEQGKEIIVKTSSSNYETAKIDIQDLKRVGKSYITSSYRTGFDEIEFIYKDNDYLETIQDLLSKEITGFEIVRHQDNSCTIKDLTGHSKDEFSTALRRTWLLLLDMSNESLSFIKNKKTKLIKKIILIDYSINKFTNFCLRSLIKKGHSNYKKTPLYYNFVKSLEELADKYKELCKVFSESQKDPESKVINNFIHINNFLNSAYLLFYKPDSQKIEILFQDINNIHKNLQNSKKPLDIYLSFISRDIKNLLPLMIELNI